MRQANSGVPVAAVRDVADDVLERHEGPHLQLAGGVGAGAALTHEKDAVYVELQLAAEARLALVRAWQDNEVLLLQHLLRAQVVLLNVRVRPPGGGGARLGVKIDLRTVLV